MTTDKSPTIFLISDLHFNHNISAKRLTKVLQNAQDARPTHIIIAGDTIDSIDEFKDEKTRTKMLNWLTKLSQIAPIFVCLGNHEFKKHSKKIMRYEPLIDAIKSIPHCHLLDNSDFHDEQVYIYGLTAPIAYWGGKHHAENKTILKQALSKAHFAPMKNHYNFFLFHSPVFLSDPEIAPFLKEFDYIVSGHMHNGVVPDFLAKIWHSDRGLVGPTKSLLPRQARNKHLTSTVKLSKAGKNGPKHIILGAVTTLAGRPLNYFQFLFAPHSLTITLDKTRNL